MLIAVQEACARIGAVTGKGIAATVKERYSKKVLYGVLALILVANTINLGADLGAMGAAAQLIVPVNFTVLVLSSRPRSSCLKFSLPTACMRGF